MRSCSAASRSTWRFARAATASGGSHFRNLAQPGGPGLSRRRPVKSLAATYQVDAAPNEQGKIGKRPATLADCIPPPYRNEQEARYALNGALPPDLSLIAKARAVEAETPVLSRARPDAARHAQRLTRRAVPTTSTPI